MDNSDSFKFSILSFLSVLLDMLCDTLLNEVFDGYSEVVSEDFELVHLWRRSSVSPVV